ncbi:heme exporter protein CcmB [Acidicapsa acidisoli]|uniref:heme exporter protein CcmB n=1 Tax=Acidicapsa acidisoli TaxID=1615681 RepID=UPI00295BB77C|nr:heme exporter protein CcmB [Acidicapsa acidisoli]
MTPSWTGLVWSHLRKDLRIEWRSRDAINSMLFFALLVVVLFSMAFDPSADTSREIAGGVLCVATLFASVSALNQAWAREIRHQVLDALRMTEGGGAALFFAKVLANFLFVSIVQCILGPIFFIFYNLHPLGDAWLLTLVIPLGTWALVANGTFFAALSIRSRNRELLLPLILFPIFLPALLAMVQSVKTILTGDGSDPSLVWIKMLGGYDIIFTTISLLLFDTVLEAE